MFNIEIAKDELKKAADMALQFCVKSRGDYKGKLKITAGDDCIKLHSFYESPYERDIFNAVETKAKARVLGEGEIVLSKQSLQILYTFDGDIHIFEGEDKEVIAEHGKKLISINADNRLGFGSGSAERITGPRFVPCAQKDLIFSMKYSEFIKALNSVEPFMKSPEKFDCDQMGLTFFNVNIKENLIEGCNGFMVAWRKINPANIAQQKNLLLDRNFISLTKKYKPDDPDSEIRFYQVDNNDSNMFAAETDGFVYYQSDSNDNREYINANKYRKYTYEYNFKSDVKSLLDIVKEIAKVSRKDKQPPIYIKKFLGELYTLYDGDGYMLINKLNSKELNVPDWYIKCLDANLFGSMLNFFSGHDDITICAQDGETTPVFAGDTNDGVMLLPMSIRDGMVEKVNKNIEKFA